jgi:hypothetical protein
LWQQLAQLFGENFAVFMVTEEKRQTGKDGSFFFLPLCVGCMSILFTSIWRDGSSIVLAIVNTLQIF